MNEPDRAREPGSHRDLRMPALGLVAWATAALAAASPTWGIAVVVGAVLVIGAAAHCAGSPLRGPTVLAWVLLALAVGGGVVLRATAVRESPVVALARSRAVVTAVVDVSTDPRIVQGRFGARVMLRATVRELVGRGHRELLRAPVLIFGQAERDQAVDPWRGVGYGSRISFRGRLSPSLDGSTAALVSASSAPRTVRAPPVLVRGVDHVRAGIRGSVTLLDPSARALIPALIDGDESAIPDDMRSDFQVTGLTHLLAVSGTNLTLVVGSLLLITRWIGLRARALTVVGCVGVIGFVLLARAEPSVLRAAAMGTVALLGLGNAGAQRGPRALGGCVVFLMLLAPGLAVSAGFVLSVLATSGIIFIAPPWAAAMRRWLPQRVGWLAEAIAVPTAAQVACTPVVAMLSGQVSLIAVPANMFAAVAVAPATVIGLLAGLVDLVCAPLAHVMVLPAGWSAEWIVAVARRTAAVPTPAGDISGSIFSQIVLIMACAVALPVLGRIFARRWATVVAAAGLAFVVTMPVAVWVPRLGWPPRGWVVVACNVGQGDGLALRVSAHAAVVVDSGPDPGPMNECLQSLRVTRVPLVLLTHFHADHIGGLAGVLKGRRVGAIEVSPYAVPEAGAEQVHALASEHHIPIVTAEYGEVRRIGPLAWQVLAPSEPAPAGSDSPPNDDSVVMYVQTRGIRILMMGDEETGSQAQLEALYPHLRADVLKVAHHGSAKQDPDLVRSLGARVGLISVGADNDYGHPAPSLLALLGSAGIRAYRTDQDGSVAVAVRSGRVVVVHQ